MKNLIFLSFACVLTLVLLSGPASGQILINELDINPGGSDDGCEYVELIGTPGAAVENIHFVSLEGDSNKGQATAVITFGVPGPVFGTNGILAIVSAVGCGARAYPAESTVIPLAFLNTGVLQNGTNSYLLISSATAIAPGTDLDTNDDGTLDALPAGAEIIDGVAWSDGGATDVTYGTVLKSDGTVIGGATRFLNNKWPNNSKAWYAAARTGQPAETTYSSTIRTFNFPSNGVLTPGAPNAGDVIRDAQADLDGNGRSDYQVVRAAGGAGSQLTWLNAVNGGNPTYERTWGVSGDIILSGDFDGDGRDDPAVWRPSNATFYIIQSATLTIRIDQFGEANDDPRVVADYNGDGRDDLAVYRDGAQSRWFYKADPFELFKTVEWGQTGDTPAPGDYDGDGKADFVVRRAQGGNGQFWKRTSGDVFSTETFGLADDIVAPGDYDGDGKTDICVVRNVGGTYVWDFEPSATAGSSVVTDTWGITGDIVAQGDYDGDGKTDYGVWRPGAQGTFYTMTVGTRSIFTKPWGQTDDVPVTGFNTF
ncbi:MAG: VCBS repeat-containing protein [Chloracidobacterium sp.]|nr:VCBS repeat-containing protein [Chloracidobacterium sp.]